MIHLSCGSIAFVQWVGAAFALAAAVFWFAASVARLPADQITWQSIDEIVPSLRRQGRLNAFAAGCAAIAALIQGFLLVTPTCINLG